jgi:hypothetical protein
MHESWRANENAGFYRVRLRLGAVLGGVILLALVCVLTCRSQSPGMNVGQQPIHQTALSQPDLSTLSSDAPDPVMIERRIRALNVLRQKQMVADTDKLLKLARELNDEVAKANTGTLTPDELHKIADIEKLARSVRQKMTDETGEVPSLLPPPPPIFYPMQ